MFLQVEFNAYQLEQFLSHPWDVNHHWNAKGKWILFLNVKYGAGKKTFGFKIRKVTTWKANAHIIWISFPAGYYRVWPLWWMSFCGNRKSAVALTWKMIKEPNSKIVETCPMIPSPTARGGLWVNLYLEGCSQKEHLRVCTVGTRAPLPLSGWSTQSRGKSGDNPIVVYQIKN